MKEEQKITILNKFQTKSYSSFRSLGFSADTSNTIFGIIIEMRNIVLSAEKEDTILLHKHIGLCTEHLANYATANDIKLSDAVLENYHLMVEKTEAIDLEEYLEKIKDDLTFTQDIKEHDKIAFIQKCWISIFVDDYHDDFIKIERILKRVIEDNKIKFPQA